jgi:hypothetical protein
MSRPAPVSVVETPEFLAATRRVMDEQERGAVIDYRAHNPLAGDSIPGTGGVRKVRWALEGRGKRGGARVVYYYHSDAMPIFALTAYAKNDRADLDRYRPDRGLGDTGLALLETAIHVLTDSGQDDRGLSQADRNDFRRLTALLVERYVRRSRR